MTTTLVKTTSAVNGRSVRQRIIDALEAKLIAMVGEDGKPLWNAIYYGSPDEVGNERTPFMCIDFGTEEKKDNYGGCTIYDLPVFLHMRWRNITGLDAQDRYLYYLALLQKAVLADHNLGGLTQNIEEDSNNHSILGIQDAYPSGTLSVVITYKTRLHNPYKSIHESL